MKAYKATYNFKCLNQTYKVGKTYTADRMEICHYGIHCCKEMHSVLDYYQPCKDFVLLEIEVLGNIEEEGNKLVTDKIKVLRVVPKEEYTPEFIRMLAAYEFYEDGNIKVDHRYGSAVTYTYDERGNMITETVDDIDRAYTYTYDDRNNLIFYTNNRGLSYSYIYDERNNKTSTIHPDGDVVKYKYDERNNCIETIYSDGHVRKNIVAIITETDE
jgi:YD repeat-containing protein